MRAFWLVLCLAFSFVVATAQEYRARSGETIMRVSIEGRGNIFIKLHVKEAPKTCAQVIKLARSGFYDGQRFHKVIKSPRPFLAQVGDPASRSGDINNVGTGGSGTAVDYENSGFSNEVGAVGLATLQNKKDSGDSQFYMLLDRASFLDNKYTVFGQVVEGMEVLRKVELGDRVTSVTITGG